MKDVFISYKAEEFDEANWVKSVLENNGISCWMAPSCIPGGSSYAVEIPNAIRGSKVVVLILSTRAQASKWVSKEIDVALNEGKVVLPFMLENCPLKDDFNFYLTNVQRYAAYENKVAAMEKMIREIKAIIDSAKTAEEPGFSATESQSTESKWEQFENDKVVDDASNSSIEDKITNKIDKIVSSRDKFCTASLICGILSLFTFIGFIGIAAMILAILGLKRIAQNGQKGEKFAIAGHILGCVGTFFGMLTMASGGGVVIAIISIIICSVLVKKRYEEV